MDLLARPLPQGPTLHLAGSTVNVSVVIPTLNEARNLPYLFQRLPRGLHEIIVVDGHSTDETVGVARALCPQAKIILQEGRGKGDALRCGFAASTGDIIVMLDADGSADPEEIALFVHALQAGADFAKGSRFTGGGGSADITHVRHLGNFGLTRLVNLLFGTRYTDLCYGYNAFWRHCLPVLRVDCDGFEVETLINLRLARSDLRVVEVPSFEEARLHGASNLRVMRDGLRVQRTILREWVRQPTAASSSPINPAHITGDLLGEQALFGGRDYVESTASRHGHDRMAMYRAGSRFATHWVKNPTNDDASVPWVYLSRIRIGRPGILRRALPALASCLARCAGLTANGEVARESDGRPDHARPGEA
jgi:glycosyltransferase involved in cell wall biosynthesis